MVTFWVTFCLGKFITFWLEVSSFNTWFVVGILRFQKWFDVDVFGYQNELCCRYFGLFLAWRLLGLLFEKFCKVFFKSSGHPVSGKHFAVVLCTNLFYKIVIKSFFGQTSKNYLSTNKKYQTAKKFPLKPLLVSI